MAFNRGASHGNHSSAADAAVADVFLLSTRAGGLGINLATVSHFFCRQKLSQEQTVHGVCTGC